MQTEDEPIRAAGPHPGRGDAVAVMAPAARGYEAAMKRIASQVDHTLMEDVTAIRRWTGSRGGSWWRWRGPGGRRSGLLSLARRSATPSRSSRGTEAI